MKKLYLSICMSLFAAAAWAQSSATYEVDGLIYEEIQPENFFSEKRLVGYVPGKISENLVIPDNVTKPGSFADHYVTAIGDGALEGAPIKSVKLPSMCSTIGARLCKLHQTRGSVFPLCSNESRRTSYRWMCRTQDHHY